MKRMAIFLLIALFLLMMSGCNIFDPFGPPKTAAEETGPDPTEGEGETAPDEAAGLSEAPAFVYTGRDKIFYDNTQAMFSFTNSPEYMTVMDALLSAQSLRDTGAYVLRITGEGETDKENKPDEAQGNLHWQEIEFDRLKVNFDDKDLYTFPEMQKNGVYPKLAGQGPMQLLFADGVLDADNLSIIVTDLMENSFGLKEMTGQIARLLSQKTGVEAALYGFRCSDFSGKISFPYYKSGEDAGKNEVKTVQNYRGTAPCYLLVLGPVSEVEDFDSRFRDYLRDTVEIEQARYINRTEYTGETGLGGFAALRSLEEKVKGGNAQSLNYIVNAQLTAAEGERFRFAYDRSHTVKEAREEVQLSLAAPLDEKSPFKSGGLTVSNLKAEVIDADGHKTELPEGAVTVELERGETIEAWKAGYSGQDLEPAAQERVLLVRTSLKAPDKKTTVRITFDLTADRETHPWIERYSADIKEYDSLPDILPPGDGADQLLWQAGATDILTRTVDLIHFETTLSRVVPEQTRVAHIELILSR